VRFEVIAAGGVVFSEFPDNTKFLLLKHVGGHWGFPKGHVEQGESVEFAALREIREETGTLDFTIVERLEYELHYQVFEDGKRRPKRVVLYLVEIPYPPKININTDEHVDYCWGTLEEVKSLLTHENAHPALEEAMLRVVKRKKQ
jgi:8-oxo-dGTP pyrophosphatase MutT (NUDIX family)